MPASRARVTRRLVRRLVSSEGRRDLVYEWRRRLRGEPALPGRPIRSVLVVCHGNLCRSPFAAAVLARSVPRIEVRSAGLLAAAGHAADPVAARVARRFSVCLDDHRTRPLRDADVRRADLILAMEGRHAAELRRRHPDAAARVRLLGDFLERPPHGIPDPWGRPEPVFEATFERLHEAVGRLAHRLAERAA